MSGAGGTAIPPGVYDIAFGWDPEMEVQRLLWAARRYGLMPTSSALELGCGTGRLIDALRTHVESVRGIELSSAMAEYARAQRGVDVRVADMSEFDLSRRFELVFTSANTLRCVTRAQAIERMWSCVHAHLEPGGVFVADLELGIDAEAEMLGTPRKWMLSRGDALVHASWEVVAPPSHHRPCTRIEWSFELRRGGRDPRVWREQFDLHACDAAEFVRLATSHSGLEFCGAHEIRDPYLLERPLEQAIGRLLVVLRRPAEAKQRAAGA